MATAVSDDVELTSTGGESRPIAAWLTTFPLTLAVVDPYTHESAWILATVDRVFEHYRGADCRVAWLVTASAEEAERFLGPHGERFLTFADPDRAAVAALGLATLPALVVIRQDQEIAAVAEGWDPVTWREVIEELAAMTGWSRPSMPARSDPAPYPGTPATR